MQISGSKKLFTRLLILSQYCAKLLLSWNEGVGFCRIHYQKTTEIMNSRLSKILALIAVFALGTAFPIGEAKPLLSSVTSIGMLFFAGLFSPFLIKKNAIYNQIVLEYPKWSDTFSADKPLTYTHFISYLTLCFGLGALLGGFAFAGHVNHIGVSFISLGLGIIYGNTLAAKSNKSEERS